MQRVIARSARQALPLARGHTLSTAGLAASLRAPSTTGRNCVALGAQRAFGSERKWKPRCVEESEEKAPVETQKFKDGAQRIEFWENDAGALVAQHDELEDIESCRWALKCICERLCQPVAGETMKQKARRMMALRFVLDLEERVEALSDEGYGTCAIDIFERPWVLTCGDNTEILRLRPRPDSLLRRAAFAALSPVLAPAGALVAYVKSGSTNSMAAFKWYFNAVAELPTTVELDSCYQVEGSESDLEACASSVTFSELRHLISGSVPQLSI